MIQISLLFSGVTTDDVPYGNLHVCVKDFQVELSHGDSRELTVSCSPKKYKR